MCFNLFLFLFPVLRASCSVQLKSPNRRSIGLASTDLEKELKNLLGEKVLVSSSPFNKSDNLPSLLKSTTELTMPSSMKYIVKWSKYGKENYDADKVLVLRTFSLLNLHKLLARVTDFPCTHTSSPSRNLLPLQSLTCLNDIDICSNFSV